jgi:peroxiredoxin
VRPTACEATVSMEWMGWTMNGAGWLERVRRLVAPGAMVMAAGLVVVLGLQVRALRRQVLVERRKPLLPAAGQVVPPVRTTTLAGDSVLLGEGAPGTRQVLFVFNTSCGVCVKTLPAWQRVAAQLAGDSAVALVGWSQDPDSLTVPSVAAHGLPFPVVAGLPYKYLKLYHAWGVPATLVVDAEGSVLYGRPGILTAVAGDSVVAAARGGADRLRNDHP